MSNCFNLNGVIPNNQVFSTCVFSNGIPPTSCSCSSCSRGACLLLSGGVMNGPIDMNDNSITQVSYLTTTGPTDLQGNSLNNASYVSVSGINSLSDNDPLNEDSKIFDSGTSAGTRFIGATVSGAPTGSGYEVGDFVIDQTGQIWIYTSSLSWVVLTSSGSGPFLPLAGGTMTGSVDFNNQHIEALSYVSVDGTTGATVTSRYVGGTVAGAPTTGTFNVGDFIISNDGYIYICTVAGSPGSWNNGGTGNFLPLAGGTMSGGINMGANTISNINTLQVTGKAGATTVSRYVGGTVAGAPTTGAFNVGDFVISNDGYIYICKVAGSPGLWNNGGTGNFLPLAGGTMGGNIVMDGNSLTTIQTAQVTGTLGATTVSRYVGGTVSGAPTTGTFNVGDFVISNDGYIYICTVSGTPGTWNGGAGNFLPLSGGTMSGNIGMGGNSITNANIISSSGITGAVAASRYVGATVSGAPVSGTFQKGDFVIAQNGSVYVCTTAGTPGTWSDGASGIYLPLAGGTMSGTINMSGNTLNMNNGQITNTQILEVKGTTGATNASRYVGGTATGAPSTGTFNVGDYVISADGNVYICTVAGSPGTWNKGGLGTFLPLSGGTMSGNIDMNNNQITNTRSLAILGLTGATTATRLAGGTTSGAPSTGTFLTGDYVISLDNNVYVCTSGGTPGTWQKAGTGSYLSISGGTMSGNINMSGNSLLMSNGNINMGGSGSLNNASFVGVTGITGATTPIRYVGGTVAGAPLSGTFQLGDCIISLDGSVYVCTTAGTPGTWTTSGSGSYLPLSGGTMSGTINMNGNSITMGAGSLVMNSGSVQSASSVALTGLTGATTATRYVGGTLSGAPSTGSFSRNDYVISADGNVYVCTTAGSPGVWVKTGTGTFLPLAGGTMTGDINMGANAITNISNLAVSGLTGATIASRYVGATSGGAPSSGTFSIGDYVVSIDGNIYICIAGGNPGTWNKNGIGTFLPLAGGTMSGTINMSGNTLSMGSGTINMGNGSITNATTLAITGLTGATNASRYVGGTSSGAPSSGTFSAGDYVISVDGNIYICTVGGTPGTWNRGGTGTFLPLAGGTMSGTINMSGNSITMGGGTLNMNSGPITNVTNVAVVGLTGATNASRYVGGTSSGAPSSGTFATGDYVISVDGNVYICTSGGTPGTWQKSGTGTFLPLAGGTMSGTLNMNNNTITMGGGTLSMGSGTLSMGNGPITGATSVALSGLTGATTATRYVGGTASGSPSTGTFSTGDYVVSVDGNIYICTSGGTPGTWNRGGSGVYLPLAGGTMTGAINMGANAITNTSNLAISGLTGAVNASRYVGGTSSGAPASGTFVTGDFIISADGNVYICTVGGSPGTWQRTGTGIFLPLSGGTMSGTLNMNNNTITMGGGTLNMGSGAVTNASNISVSGLTGAVTVTRYVGGTASNAPVSGTFNAGDYVISVDGNVYICTVGGTSGTWQKSGTGTFLPLAGGTMSGAINMGTNAITNTSNLAISGLTGATNATRYVGSTTSGAPASGTFSTRDYIISGDGNVYICTTGGSPGTWQRTGTGIFLPLAGGTMSGTITMSGNTISMGGGTLSMGSGAITSASNLSVSGLTGATNASRYVGGTSSGAPSTGTFSTGDYIISVDGNIYICTLGGTPGTWNRGGTGAFLPLAGGTMSGAINMGANAITNTSNLAVSGLTGAVTATRYVGGTASGSPSTGAFSTGDYVISVDGNMYICTSGGSPGTWSRGGSGVYLPLAGGTMSGTINMNGNSITMGGGTLNMNNGAITNVTNLAVSGLTGAVTATRYVGGTASGSPSTGTFNTGDYVISVDGNIYICTSGGTPGTWNRGGSGVFLPLAGGTMSGTINMGSNTITNTSSLAMTGLTGATNASRYVGGTAAGAPLSGSFNAGDYIISVDGNVYICTVAGTPGTWQRSGTGTFLPLAGGTMSGTITMSGNTISMGGGTLSMGNGPITGATNVAVSGLTGAVTATRYVGGTASGSPSTGTFNTGDYVISVDGNIYICTSGGAPGTWNRGGTGTFLPLAGGTMSGAINMGANAITNTSNIAISGLTGATTASRYVGGTSSGAPISGTFTAGDYVISVDGNIYICTVGGTPGTWNRGGTGTFLPLAGGTMSGSINMGANAITNTSNIAISGLTGATNASRYVGGTSSGAPVSGTFVAGDHIISVDGNVYVCTVGGTPGTWQRSGTGTFLPLAGGTMSGTITMSGNTISMGGGTLSMGSGPITGATNVAVSGLTGAVTATRYVGGTASGSPSTGTFNTGDYVISVDGNIYICTSGGTPGTWNRGGTGTFLPLAGGTMSGAINMGANAITNTSNIAISGLTGATNASRYVGGTASGAPVAGTFAAGDYVVSVDGNVYVCTVGGTPGTWQRSGTGTFLPLAGGTMSGAINMGANAITNTSNLAVSGLTGATTASRYVGSTSSGAPTSGTFSTNDYIVSGDGNMYICTAGGSPGTWTQSSALQNAVNVKFYGARGNGVTNDATAIQNAINYARTNNMALYFPPGQYIVTSPLNFTQWVGFCIFGAGSGNAATSSSALIASGITSSTAFDFSGSSSGYLSNLTFAVKSGNEGTWNALVLFARLQGVANSYGSENYIQNCVFTGASVNGKALVFAYQSEVIRFFSCRFDTGGVPCVVFTGNNGSYGVSSSFSLTFAASTGITMMYIDQCNFNGNNAIYVICDSTGFSGDDIFISNCYALLTGTAPAYWFQFKGGWSYVTMQYCRLEGSGLGATRGAINLSSASLTIFNIMIDATQGGPLISGTGDLNTGTITSGGFSISSFTGNLTRCLIYSQSNLDITMTGNISLCKSFAPGIATLSVSGTLELDDGNGGYLVYWGPLFGPGSTSYTFPGFPNSAIYTATYGGSYAEVWTTTIGGVRWSVQLFMLNAPVGILAINGSGSNLTGFTATFNNNGGNLLVRRRDNDPFLS